MPCARRSLRPRARDTLVVVTANHGHTFTLAGYPRRGNPILGLVVEPGATGPKLALDGKPYTTLGYANGSGHAEKPADSDIESRRTPNAGRHLHPDDDVDSPGFSQEALVPLGSATHGGEDVAIYAGGPQAHLFRGTMEQHVVYHVGPPGFRLVVARATGSRGEPRACEPVASTDRRARRRSG